MESKENNKKSPNVMGTYLTNPLLTDFYLLTMLYAHWKNKRHDQPAVFDMYFRKCAFGMNYAIFGGIDECFEFLENYKITEEHIKYLSSQLPNAEFEFFDFLRNLNLNDIKIYGFKNSALVLPNEPLFRLEGPLAKVQILETTLLNLCNYPTLISSLANRLREIFGDKITLIENGSQFGQSPFGSILGVKYAIAGGVDKSTSIIASKNYNIELYSNFSNIFEDGDLEESANYFNNEDFNIKIYENTINALEFFNINYLKNFGHDLHHNNNFLLKIKNNLFSIINLKRLTYELNFNSSIAIDKGPDFIVSSTQPALGMVYKLMEMNTIPCIKFSEEKDKQTIPGSKSIFRLYDSNNNLIGDYLSLNDEHENLGNKNTLDALFNEESVQTLTFEKAELMNPIIFSEGKPKIEFEDIDTLHKKALANLKINKENSRLYISRKLRNIIISETDKMNLIH